LKLVKIKLLAVGRTKEEWIKQGLLHYNKLLKRDAQVEFVEVKDERITKPRETNAILKAEADRILKFMEESSPTGSSTLYVALDKEGKQLSSEDLAHLFREKLNRGYSEFIFVLGGALGLSPQVLDACQMRLSLSQMTFTHEMSRIILLEQIYRAFSILKGTDYHK
jgi:23S rRNA (pseudouridine1915-N3)-methyltransferase